MLDLDRWTEIVESLRANRLRTALTALGVFWGMFMLVVMLGFGDGLEQGMKKNMGRWSTNAVFMWGGRTTLPYEGFRPGRRVQFQNSDVEALSGLDGLEHLVARNALGGYRGSATTVRNGQTGTYAVMGDYPVFENVAVFEMVSGRFLNDLDIADHRKVAVIGEQVVTDLYERGEETIGSHIAINGVYFQVVGTFRVPTADDQGESANATVHVPFSTFQRAFNYGERVSWIAMTARPEASAVALEEDARALIAARRQVHPDDEEGIRSYNSERQYRQITTLFVGVRFFVWFVGTMTLLAGVVGVSNIMLIVVQERTREIGLRRAIGATPASVVGMIVQEAIALTAVAGYAGVVAGVLLLEVTGSWVEASNSLGRPTVAFGAVFGAGAVLLAAGALAGVVPARKAASIRPVEALHAE